MRLPSSGPELVALLRQNILTVLAASTFGLLFIYFIFDPFAAPYAAPEWHSPVLHTVLFKFKPSADPDEIQKACDAMMALKDDCLNPNTLRPYIKSLRGGRDNSPEGQQHGATHGFIVEFASATDRDYYLDMDPAHQTFKKMVGGLADGVIVVDFENGSF